MPNETGNLRAANRNRNQDNRNNNLGFRCVRDVEQTTVCRGESRCW